jgi:hypothetical protein
LIEGGVEADVKCFEQFNSQGSINGNCGKQGGIYGKCEHEWVHAAWLPFMLLSPLTKILFQKRTLRLVAVLWGKPVPNDCWHGPPVLPNHSVSRGPGVWMQSYVRVNKFKRNSWHGPGQRWIALRRQSGNTIYLSTHFNQLYKKCLIQ